MGNQDNQLALFLAPGMPGEVPLFGEAYMAVPDEAYDRRAAFDPPRCQVCHRLNHHPGDANAGHCYKAPQRCGACYRREGECQPGHEFRATGTERPRGETRFPVGALVQLTGGPRAYVGSLGVVIAVESPTMRHISLGREGAPTYDTRVGVRGLRLYVGKNPVL
jgi:hypothetical protein